MISNLSNSFRVLALYNSAATSAFTNVCKNQLREICLYQPMLKSLEEKLGLPNKPKRPSSPYFRFLNEVRPSVQAKNPKLKTSELCAIIGKMWTTMDTTKKEKFSKGYKDELVAYMNEIAKYKDSLTGNDVRKIKEMKFEQKERKTVLKQKKKCRDLGKPRKPAASFLRFLREQTDRQPKEQYLDYVKRVSVKWQTLSDAEREKYKPSAQEEANYKKALQQWEDKMRKLGHYDIISSESVSTAEMPKPRSRRSSDE